MYHVSIGIVGTAVVGALIGAKVVVLLDKTPVASAFRSGFIVLHVLWRSIAYTGAVFLVTLAERLFHAYRAHGELRAAASELWANRDIEHVLAKTLSIGLAFVVFNGASEIDRRLGEGGLRRLFFSRRVEDTEG